MHIHALMPSVTFLRQHSAAADWAGICCCMPACMGTSMCNCIGNDGGFS